MTQNPTLTNLTVRTFGAKGDGTTDDLSAFAAAIATMSSVATTPTGSILYVPPGTYYLSGNLHVSRPIVLSGSGGSSILSFAAGKGIIVDYSGPTTGTTAPDGGTGAGSVIEKLSVSCLGLSLSPWAANTAYVSSPAALLQTPAEFRWYYACVGAGTSGASRPVVRFLASDVHLCLKPPHLHWRVKSP
jgi:Pectate lyase superfamily protein